MLRIVATKILGERNLRFIIDNRPETIIRLQAVRDKGDWEGWLRFFLAGVASVANEATDVARRIVALREEQRSVIQETFGRTTADGLRLHEQLFQHPFLSVHLAQQLTGKGFAAANRLVGQMVDAGILSEVTGRARKRVFLHGRYFRMFDDSEVGASDVATPEEADETIAL